jgi:chemotaxis protein CheD
MDEKVLVGIAELKVSTNPGKLVTVGLGSCVGIILHDPSAKVGALIHAMLPKRSYGMGKSNKAKYVETAIPLAVEEMLKLGARRRRITARLVGGARMFTLDKEVFIGYKNVEVAEKILKDLNIKIIGKETGGTIGRTVEFDILTGRVLVRTATRRLKEL